MKILLAGDWHGNSQHAQNVFAHAARVGADAIIQLGDFGYGWAFSQRKVTGEKYDTFTDHVSKFAERTGVPCFWLPGNHENYDALEEVIASSRPKCLDGTWEIADSVFYIPRGTLLEWGGVKFLCCGGAASVDKRARLDRMRHGDGDQWWAQEAITEGDVEKCKAQGRADVLLTHDFPIECEIIDRHLDPYWGEEAQQATIASRTKISGILANCDAKRLFHGHLHLYYSEMIWHPHRFLTRDMHQTHVTGLQRDGYSIRETTYLFDTELFDKADTDEVGSHEYAL